MILIDKEKQKELVGKLINAANKVKNIQTANMMVVHENNIVEICKEYNVSRDEAYLIIKDILNEKHI